MTDKFDIKEYLDKVKERSSYKIMNNWIMDDSGQRFGQYFVNKYISQPWPELFYADDYQSHVMITKWLADHQYENDLPPLRKDHS